MVQLSRYLSGHGEVTRPVSTIYSVIPSRQSHQSRPIFSFYYTAKWFTSVIIAVLETEVKGSLETTSSENAKTELAYRSVVEHLIDARPSVQLWKRFI